MPLIRSRSPVRARHLRAAGQPSTISCETQEQTRGGAYRSIRCHARAVGARDELDDLAVRDDGRLVHERVVRKELLAAALVANQELTVHKVMAADLAVAEQLIKLAERPAPGWTRKRIQTEVSTRTIRLPSASMRPRLPAGVELGRPRLLPAKRSQPFVGPLPHQGLESQADRISVTPGATYGSRLSQEALIDVKRLLHAIPFCPFSVWHFLLASLAASSRASLTRVSRAAAQPSKAHPRR